MFSPIIRGLYPANPACSTQRAFKRRQEDKGFALEQADRLAETRADLEGASATKDDLDDLEARSKQRDELSEERFRQRIGEVEKRLLRWMMSGPFPRYTVFRS